MSLLVWAAAASLAVQSLGEVAEREEKRRERNAEAGVEVVSYTSSEGAIEPDTGDDASATDSREVAPEDTFLEGDSPLDEERERGKTFEPRIEEIARAADLVDELYQGYMDRCYNRYAIGVTPPGIGIPVGPSDPVNVEMGRNWLLVLETPGPTSVSIPRVPERNIMLVQTPQCQALWGNIVEAASGVRQAMQALLADARRQRILPGVIRELRRKHRLDWSGWDR